MIGNFLDQFWSLTFGGLSLGFIYILIALGYTMVYGVLRMINFANSEVFMIATFATVIIIRDVYNFTQTSEPATGLRLWLILGTALIASMVVAGVISVVIEIVAYRRLRRMNSGILAPLISAIGVSMVLAEAVRMMTDSRPVASPRAMEKS
ncbi:MAG: ABC transporter permease subunit, partial [Actinomycetota bacterium]